MFVFKKRGNNSYMSNLTENYARTTTVLCLQAISFRILSIKLNSQLQVTVSETFQLKAVSEIGSVFLCFDSAVPVEFGNSSFWGLEENPYRRRDASQQMPYTAATLLSAQSLSQWPSHRGGSNQQQLEEKEPKKNLKEYYIRETEVFF